MMTQVTAQKMQFHNGFEAQTPGNSFMVWLPTATDDMYQSHHCSDDGEPYGHWRDAQVADVLSPFPAEVRNAFTAAIR
jgi:hypothetical protein